MKAAVVIFPGSNCDRDVFTTLQNVMKKHGSAPVKVWHADSELPKVDLVVIPGGFTYGDYLRCGAIAANSPIMREVISHAEKGGNVLGICNGFQILTESKLLPGTLMRNLGLKFICRDVYLKVENNKTQFTQKYQKNQVVRIPIAHHDGNYFADKKTIQKLQEKGQIAFRYSSDKGNITKDSNPNGSESNIAGIFNEKKNVLGMMPHPERVSDEILGGTDGRPLFESLVESFK